MGGTRAWALEGNVDYEDAQRTAHDGLKNIAVSAIHLGIGYISAFMFSADEWDGPQKEIELRMRLIIRFCERHTDELIAEGIRLVFVGARDGLPPAVQRALEESARRTATGRKGVLALCVNYSGQQEVVDAVRKLLREQRDPMKLTVDDITRRLYHPDLPDLDLIIRTAGEYSFSNFMLWRAMHARLMFVDKRWPDFTRQDLAVLLKQYVALH
jgi:undecaprenyl diphosphate synthase